MSEQIEVSPELDYVLTHIATIFIGMSSQIHLIRSPLIIGVD